MLLVWTAVPYLVFSVLATRMPGYVMIGAPAIFLLLASGVVRAYQWLPPRGRRRTAGLVVLGVTVLLTGRYLLEPRGPLANRDGSPAFARDLERLANRLGLPDAVLFNVPRPIDAMFYSGYTAYERMPTKAEVRDIVASGRPLVIYSQPVVLHWCLPAGRCRIVERFTAPYHPPAHQRAIELHPRKRRQRPWARAGSTACRRVGAKKGPARIAPDRPF